MIERFRIWWREFWAPARCQCPPGQECDEWMGWH